MFKPKTVEALIKAAHEDGRYRCPDFYGCSGQLGYQSKYACAKSEDCFWRKQGYLSVDKRRNTCSGYTEDAIKSLYKDSTTTSSNEIVELLAEYSTGELIKGE